MRVIPLIPGVVFRSRHQQHVATAGHRGGGAAVGDAGDGDEGCRERA